MDNNTDKFRLHRTLVYVLAFIILFEVGMLYWAIPVRTTFITITLSAVALLCLYLIVLCLRLIRELQQNSEK